MCRPPKARHVNSEDAAFGIADLEVALFADEAIAGSR
jgi:hypothetical protein